MSAPGAPVAKITDRFLAYLLDTAPFAVGYYISFFWLILHPRPWVYALSGWELAAAWTCLYVLYHSVGNFFGGSPGKRLLGLRVVGPGGAPLGAARSVLRAAGLLISTPLSLGFLWAIVDRRSRAWHDWLAGSLVLEARQKTPAQALGSALLSAAALLSLALLATWTFFLRPTPEDLLAVAKAREGLRLLGMAQERHKRLHGAYTRSLADLAAASGDPGQFRDGMIGLFEFEGFQIAATRERYAFRARAKDRRKTVVTFSGPSPQ